MHRQLPCAILCDHNVEGKASCFNKACNSYLTACGWPEMCPRDVYATGTYLTTCRPVKLPNGKGFLGKPMHECGTELLAGHGSAFPVDRDMCTCAQAQYLPQPCSLNFTKSQHVKA